MSDAELPGDEPAFPPPRGPEPPSPYREHQPPPVALAPDTRPRIVVVRPDPPGVLGTESPRDEPTPVGFFDGRLRVLREPYVFLANRPHLWIALLIVAASMGLSWCGRGAVHNHFVD